MCTVRFLEACDVGIVAHVFEPRAFLVTSSLASEDRSEKHSRVPGHNPQAVVDKVHASVYLSCELMYGTDILSATLVPSDIA